MPSTLWIAVAIIVVIVLRRFSRLLGSALGFWSASCWPAGAIGCSSTAAASRYLDSDSVTACSTLSWGSGRPRGLRAHAIHQETPRAKPQSQTTTRPDLTRTAEAKSSARSVLHPQGVSEPKGFQLPHEAQQQIVQGAEPARSQRPQGNDGYRRR